MSAFVVRPNFGVNLENFVAFKIKKVESKVGITYLIRGLTPYGKYITLDIYWGIVNPGEFTTKEKEDKVRQKREEIAYMSVQKSFANIVKNGMGSGVYYSNLF